MKQFLFITFCIDSTTIYVMAALERLTKNVLNINKLVIKSNLASLFHSLDWGSMDYVHQSRLFFSCLQRLTPLASCPAQVWTSPHLFRSFLTVLHLLNSWSVYTGVGWKVKAGLPVAVRAPGHDPPRMRWKQCWSHGKESGRGGASVGSALL